MSPVRRKYCNSSVLGLNGLKLRRCVESVSSRFGVSEWHLAPRTLGVIVLHCCCFRVMHAEWLRTRHGWCQLTFLSTVLVPVSYRTRTSVDYTLIMKKQHLHTKDFSFNQLRVRTRILADHTPYVVMVSGD